MIAFKVNANTGELLGSFDPQGFKHYLYVNPGSNGTESSANAFIAPYNGTYLLTGRTYGGGAAFPGSILAIQIDDDGMVISSFGIDGYKKIFTDYTLSLMYDLRDIQIAGNKLYGTYSYGNGCCAVYMLDLFTIWNQRR